MPLDRVPGKPDLYIGGIFSLRGYEGLKAANITHVVSVLRAPLNMELVKDFKHLMIEVDDVDDEYIIEHFKESNDFIAEGLKEGGGVLVHCAMGKSRSTTILIAYLLSVHPNPTPSTIQDILDQIRQARPFAEPNAGFIKQLKLYALMGCPDDVCRHPVYQRWLYKQEAKNSVDIRQAPSNVYFADEAEKSGLVNDESEYSIEWTCRKCRRSLASGEFAAEHIPKAPSSSTHGGKSRNGAPNSATDPIASFEKLASSTIQPRTPCAHIFLYPLSWMREELEAGKLDGRLECPNIKCKANVGKYAWQGLRCSCDEWVVPGIALARGRVDERKVKKKGVSVGFSRRGDKALDRKVAGLKI